MKIFKEKKLRIILLLSLLVGLLLAAKTLSLRIAPQIMETLPKNGQTQVPLTEKITVIFDKDINLSHWKFVILPDIAFTPVTVAPNKIEILPARQLNPGTKYTVAVTNLKTKKFSFIFSFITADLPPTPPLKELGDPYFYREIQEKINENYPLFKYIPYKEENFSLDYLRPLTLEVVLKKDTPEIRQEVLDWIESKGVDPKSHKIEW